MLGFILFHNSDISINNEYGLIIILLNFQTNKGAGKCLLRKEIPLYNLFYSCLIRIPFRKDMEKASQFLQILLFLTIVFMHVHRREFIKCPNHNRMFYFYMSCETKCTEHKIRRISAGLMPEIKIQNDACCSLKNVPSILKHSRR